MQKTLRFADLVKTSGRPKVATVWIDPKRDRAFSQAIKENRILTVKSENVGTRKDSGRIGFHEQKNASYLVFPEELPRNPDARVVGIRYDKLEQPKESVSLSSEARRPRELKPPKKEKSRSDAKLKTFSAVIRRTAVWEKAIRFEARDKAVASRKAKQLASEQSFDNSNAITRMEVRDVREAR